MVVSDCGIPHSNFCLRRCIALGRCDHRIFAGGQIKAKTSIIFTHSAEVHQFIGIIAVNFDGGTWNRDFLAVCIAADHNIQHGLPLVHVEIDFFHSGRIRHDLKHIGFCCLRFAMDYNREGVEAGGEFHIAAFGIAAVPDNRFIGGKTGTISCAGFPDDHFTIRTAGIVRIPDIGDKHFLDLKIHIDVIAHSTNTGLLKGIGNTAFLIISQTDRISSNFNNITAIDKICIRGHHQHGSIPKQGQFFC